MSSCERIPMVCWYKEVRHMKRHLLISILLLFGTLCGAQIMSVSSFKLDADDFSAASPDGRRQDSDGQPCALVKISTRLTGLSFDAGEACVVDVNYKLPGVWIYLPSSARRITISSRTSGTLNKWSFPVSLEPGRTYLMNLKSELPRTVKPVNAKPAFNKSGFSSHFIQSHIGAEINQGYADCMVLGLSYSFMPGRLGFYTSVDWSLGGGVAFFAGPSIRMLDGRSSTDWMLYAAPGLVPGGQLGADFGTKFGWNTGKALSRFDFSIGCQYWGDNTFVPYAGLGAQITGYSVAAVIGIFLCVLGGVL